MNPRRSTLVTSSIVLTASAVLSTVTPAFADKTWSGASSADWATLTNWVEGALPGTTETVNFNSLSAANLSGINLGVARTVQGINLTNPTGPVTINAGFTLTLTRGGLNLSAATQNLTLACPVTIQSDIHPWSTNTGITTTSPVPVRNPGANNDNIGGHIVVSGPGTVKMGTAALGIIADNGPNPYVTIGTEDWAGTDATGTVIPVTYTTDAFTGNASIVTPNTYGINNAGTTSVRFANTTGPVIVNCSNTNTLRGILMTSGADNVSILGGNIRPNRSSTAGASFSIIQNNPAKDLTIGSSLAIASSNTPVSIVKGGTGRVILTGGYFGGTGRIFIHQGTWQYGDGGTTGDPGNTASSIINNASLVFNRSNLLTVITNIGGTGSLTQAGTGELAFTTSVSTFTGPVNITGGTLSATTLANLGAGTAININGGALKFNGAFDPSVRTLTVGSSGATFDTGIQNISFASAVGNGGAGDVTKKGTGSLTLTQPAGWSGNTIVDDGTLFANNTTGSATSGSVTIGATGGIGGTGTVSGAVTTTTGSVITPGSAGVGTLTVGSLDLQSGTVINLEFGAGNDRVNVSNSDGLSIAGGTVNLYQEGSGFAIAFTGTPATYNLFQYSGALSGVPANLTVGNPQPGKSYVFGTSGGFVTLTIADTGVVRNWITNGGGSWTNAGNWNGTAPNSAQAVANFNTSLSGPATVTLDGSKTVGSLTFTSAANGYTIAQGSGGSLTFSNGGNASIVDNAGSHEIAAPVVLNNDLDVSVPLANESLSISGTISGTNRTITKTGLGALNLTGNNTFSGGLNLTGGSTTFGPSGLGTGQVTLDGTRLVWDAGNTDDITSGGRVVSLFDNTVTLDTTDNNVLLSSDFGDFGSAALTKAGFGKLTLTGELTSGGDITIAEGSLQIGTGGTTGALPQSSNILNNGELILDRSDDITLSNVISGTGSLAKDGVNNLSLAGFNSFSGETYLNSGTLTIANTGALQNSSLNYTQGSLVFDGLVTAATIGSFTGSKDLSLDNTAALGVILTTGGNGASGTYSGVLSGTGGLTKAGAGMLTLEAIHTYTGATAATGGILEISSASAISSSNTFSTSGTGRIIVTGGLISGSTGNFGVGSAGFLLNGGTADFTGVIEAAGSTGSSNSALIHVMDGVLTAQSIILGRTGQNINSTNTPTGPAAAAADTNLYITGGQVDISGDLLVGTGSSQPNSTVITRMDGGVLNVAGAVSVGLNNGDRWSILDINGGEFHSTGSAVNTGVVLGGDWQGRSAFIVRGTGLAVVERIQLGRGALNGSGLVNLIGGELYVGAGGIAVGTTGVAFVPEIRISGGTLGAKASWTTTLGGSLGGLATIKAANAADSPFNITIGGALTGTGSLVKTGTGTLALGGTNTYTGSTTVTQGILTLQPNSLSDTAVVDVSLNATLNLPNSGTDVVLGFEIDGEPQLPGTYGRLGSTAQHTTARITGEGFIQVPQEPFVIWIGGFPTLTGLNAEKGADPDKDGLTNLAEFALNGNPASGIASGKVRSRIETVGAEQALVITLPVRSTTAFIGTAPAALTITLDKITYLIEGTNDLVDFNQNVSEITPASTANPTLPALDSGWTYRTFRLAGAIPARGTKGFLRAGVEDAP